MKVRMVTEFEFGMEIAFLLLHAFSPFSTFGFRHLLLIEQTGNLKRKVFIKAYS